MQNYDLEKLAQQIEQTAEALFPDMVKFLADIVRIRTYTGEEAPAVERTLEELRAIGCDKVWMDSAGNALGQIGTGKPVLLYDAPLDPNETPDEKEWLYPPLEAVIK
ncbi:MAG: hypothetical protein LDL51_13005, partial [Chloroflexi bacterium]|nr:hypothetical protein [Chloroflexota bacterium]